MNDKHTPSRNGKADSAEHDSLNTHLSLIERVSKSDDEAWSQFVDLYAPLIFGWCRKSSLSEEDSADVTQDVFARLQIAIQKYRDKDNSTFRSWLWVVTRNKIRDFCRKKQKSISPTGGTQFQIYLENFAELESVDDPTTELQEQQLIDRALEIVKQRVDERTWQAFWKVTMENESTEDVAKELSMSTNNVRQAKSRTLRRLRELLEES